ncbi:hypothetical protein TNCV_4125181 [Trichonephila clavipes]|nr:hypothetical protein TNCV_4125181 [Trichonephila clavipes]
MRQANQQFSSILTKIGNGEQLDEIEIALIESRFCTVEEAVARRPQALKFLINVTIKYSFKIDASEMSKYKERTFLSQNPFWDPEAAGKAALVRLDLITRA